MSDTNEGTTDQTDEAQTGEDQTGTPDVKDEVTTLRSRNAGLDAKVTALSKSAREAEQRAADAAQRLADYEAGKVGNDEALRAQLEAKDAELKAAKQEATVARIEAKYPETFGLFGAAVANMTDDVLAASEARLKGVAEVVEPGKPLGNNPVRGQAGATAAAAPNKRTIADLEAEFKKLTPPWITD